MDEEVEEIKRLQFQELPIANRGRVQDIIASMLKGRLFLPLDAATKKRIVMACLKAGHTKVTNGSIAVTLSRLRRQARQPRQISKLLTEANPGQSDPSGDIDIQAIFVALQKSINLLQAENKALKQEVLKLKLQLQASSESWNASEL